jgi:hypothetical protein
MSTAHVESIDAIREFRVQLTKFQEMGNRALSDADSDVNRMTRWLEGEGLNHWTSAIRKRQEAVAKAEEAVRFKRLYKDSSGSVQSAVEELKVLKIAKDRLNEAQEKLSNVKKWTRELQKQATMYRGAVSRFAGDIAQGAPEAVAHLGALLEQLDKYMDITAESGTEPATAGAGAGGADVEQGGASMARAADEAGGPRKGKLDPAALRAAIPGDQAIFAAKPVEEAGPVQLGCGLIDSAQAGEVAKAATNAAPGDEERIVVAQGMIGAQRVFLARLDSAGIGWYLGPVEGQDSGVYNTVKVGELRAGRPDLVELLRLPVGFLAVVGPGGLEAIFNPKDENVIQSD